MQLKLPPCVRAWLRGLVCAACCGPLTARAQSSVEAGSSVFHEPGQTLNMTVIIPQVDADIGIGDALGVQAGWTADVVSGASVAVVDAPADSLDALSSASVTDTRHELSGGLRLSGDTTSLSGGYRYAFENDYRSHGFDVNARSELFERNTSLELGYARSFDRVCDGPQAAEAVEKLRLTSSDGCFEDDPMRSERDLAVHTFQVGWGQNWTPVLAMQLTSTAQLLDGFQANPYRAVRIGRTAAQEHHPKHRARFALGLGGRLWIVPLRGALSAQLRGYRDSWDIHSGSAELAYEQSIAAGMRVRVRGRYYVQSGAAFFSDDYVLHPRGRYFTGDRELSPFRSAIAGLQLTWGTTGDQAGPLLGFVEQLELVAKGDLLKAWFDEFHYDQVAIPNDTGFLASLSLRTEF